MSAHAVAVHAMQLRLVRQATSFESSHDRHNCPPIKPCPKCGRKGGLGYCVTCHGPKR